MNTKNPVSALRMETGDCYITEVPPIENVSAKNFPWNTIKNTLTHTCHFLSLYLNVTSSPYPIVSATFPQTNWRNNHIFYTISKLSCDKDHMCRPFMGSSQIQWAIYWLKICLETRWSAASIEPLIDLLACLEPKLWPKNPSLPQNQKIAEKASVSHWRLARIAITRRDNMIESYSNPRMTQEVL